MKPFRPPLIRRLANPQQGQDTAPSQGRDGGALDAKKRSTQQLQGTVAATQVTDSPAKRRRVSQVGSENTYENPIDLEDSGYMTASSSEKQREAQKTTVAPSEAEHKPVSRQVPFRGLSVTRKPSSTQQTRSGTAGKAHDAQSSDKGHDDEVYFNVLWRKFTTKKHKTWDGDGILTASRGYVSLEDISGRHMGRIMFNEPLFPGSMLSIGGKDVEIDSELPREEYISGRAFLAGSNGGIKAPPPEPTKPKSVNQRYSAPLAGGHFKSLARLISKTNAQASQDANVDVPVAVAKRSSEATQSAYKNPLKNSTVMEPKNRHEPTPRHDPSAPGAVVMRRPAKVPKGRQVVDVVVDPLLSRHLRDHQKEGVKFMYECVMGMRPFEGEGCILADDMGLGKTLQTITLLWTLLKQNPVYEAGPVVKKALIVCPVTLISNWRKEFKKWLGMDRVGVFVADGTETRLTDFTMGKSYSVMIIGYERLRNVQEQLTKGPGIDIVIADEGHRLKTVQNKSAQAIQSLNTARRVILSGTPIQNDLTEFFAMVDFVNPGLL
ncbi:helicase, partial [Ascosphaera atra]